MLISGWTGGLARDYSEVVAATIFRSVLCLIGENARNEGQKHEFLGASLLIPYDEYDLAAALNKTTFFSSLFTALTIQIEVIQESKNPGTTAI